MRIGLPLFFWLAAQLSFFALGSQTLHLPTRAFTADDGLGGATITSLLKDNRDFLWIGTPDELLLYDGTRFEPFRYADSTGAHKSFRRAYLFSLGRYGVLIAHEDGMHQFVLPAGRIRAVPTPFHGFSHRSSLHRVGASSTVFRVSTHTHTGLYDARQQLWGSIRSRRPSQITAVAVTHAGRQLMGGDTGATAHIVRVYDHTSNAPSKTFTLPFRAAFVLHLAEGDVFLDADDEHQLWWMPAGGNIRSLIYLRTPAREICAAYAADGACYIAAGHTLLRFHPTHGRVQEILGGDGTPIVRSGILVHLLPNGRTLWAGSNTNGLIRLSLEGPRLRHLRADSPVLNWSHAIFADRTRGRIYVGSYGGTVAVFDTSGLFLKDITPMLRRAGGISSAYINAIEPTPDGRLFIGSGQNPWLYDPVSGAVENLAASADVARRAWHLKPESYMGRFGVMRAAPWEWWMSNKTGLLRWRIIPSRRPQSARMEIVQAIHIAPPAPEALCQYSGAWWCATAGRLYRFDGRGLRDSFRYPIVAFATCITPDAQGRLWIATESGIAVWRAGKTERVITTDDGLPNNHVYALMPDSSGRMWGSTNGGLFAIRTDDFSVRALTGGDGLQGAEFNLGAHARDPQGRLYFGGMNGVNIVEPAVALRGELASQLTITRVAGPDTVYHAYPGPASPRALRLPHDRASLTISFTAPGLETAGAARFEYRLHAEDSVWTDNGTRREMQLFLAPGNYRVEVRLRSQPGTAAAFSVEVTPPFYRAWWFIALLVLGGGGLIAAAILRANRRRYHSRLLALETARRIQEEKNRISRELHDELGARAAVLSHNASLLREESAGNRVVASLVTRITDTTADMLTALRETVWTLKQEEVTMEDLWLRYKNFIAKLAASYTHIHFAVQEDDTLPTKALDYARALHLLRVLQEATMNAVKHSGASNITASAHTGVGSVHFSVSDNGRGFNVEAARENGEGNGLYNMEHRSAEGSLSLDIRSHAERGTVVEVRMA